MASTDQEAVYAECLAAAHDDRPISDACARTIGAMYHEGGTSDSASFATTGRIVEGLWDELFGGLYDSMDDDDRMVADSMRIYLEDAGERGPVEGWANKWVGRD